MHRTAVLNIVGLTPSLIGDHTPRLSDFIRAGKLATVAPSIPAVTCTVQSTYLTGTPPSEHGIVGNGWYDRDDAEVKFWKQSNRLVRGERIWDRARRRDSTFTVANVCWWYNMYSTADYTVTPRPMYPADGRKLPDCYTQPPELRDELQQKLGQFPLFKFWGPATSIESTQWIADAAVHIDQKYSPTLSLVYLPHLDYVLQKVGPEHPTAAIDLQEIDSVVGGLIDHFSKRNTRVILLSEYGIEPVDRPMHLNRILRKAGFIVTRDEIGRELLDAGASRAFAVADHQLAHVYVRDDADIAAVADCVRSTPGVGRVYVGDERRELQLDHERAGEILALAERGAWFTYYYWLDDARAPDFARTVDIHRKPGYDPVELFLDPAIRWPKAKIASILARRKIGMRPLMALTPLDANLVRGSHGLPPSMPSLGPLVATSEPSLLADTHLDATAVHDLLLRHIFD